MFTAWLVATMLSTVTDALALAIGIWSTVEFVYERHKGSDVMLMHLKDEDVETLEENQARLFRNVPNEKRPHATRDLCESIMWGTAFAVSKGHQKDIYNCWGPLRRRSHGTALHFAGAGAEHVRVSLPLHL